MADDRDSLPDLDLPDDDGEPLFRDAMTAPCVVCRRARLSTTSLFCPNCDPE